MRNIALFNREINLIKNETLREAVKQYMAEDTPDYFWSEGASSSGKYHPKFSQGVGGLVRHTKAVVMFAEELLRMSSYAYMKAEYKDYVIAACLLHDTVKYGIGEEIDKAAYADHGKNAAREFDHFACHYCHYRPSEFLLNAITAHMGQWTTDREDRPFTSIDRCVHLADYMASRSFIDIPEIVNEWNGLKAEEVRASMREDADLPF